jgi:hypothetical protein
MSMGSRALLCICCIPVVSIAQNNLKTTITQRYFNGIRRNLEAAADAMPAAKYGFKLTDGQMSFAEWINHSASALVESDPPVLFKNDPGGLEFWW